ncbi:hypothetical protein [Halioxenophilus sp. WMMB6]|uniref:hypothetical protein n=1 Tax=Halioxenophilus sp. WMMB6 TaxID=3073815 RepID=UPI00295E97EE|nr:hypothetical protein [Halioxenophilus sp. WMMB6]
MLHPRRWPLAVAGALLVTFPFVCAPLQAGESSDLPKWAVTTITPVHSIVSNWVDNSSRNIDSWFGTDEFLDVDNHSYLRLSQEYQWFETEPFDSNLGLRFKLDLPTTRKRLKIVFENTPEETQTPIEEEGARTGNRDLQDNDSTVIGLEKETKPGRTWRYRINAGVRLNIPLDPYVRLNGSRLWRISDSPWSLQADHRLSWFNSDGYSARSRWDLSRPLSSNRNLRSVTQLQWREVEDTLEFAQRFEINQLLGERNAIRYAWVMLGEGAGSPLLVDSYAQILFRRNLNDNYLFGDIVPELHFPEDSDYNPQWAITLRLELYFRGTFQLQE